MKRMLSRLAALLVAFLLLHLLHQKDDRFPEFWQRDRRPTKEAIVILVSMSCRNYLLEQELHSRHMALTKKIGPDSSLCES
mmetsp:Transcript_94983/g.274670  ORF Transcript_94983/g.274670 Transcript_94983/m.274670 type:complete len:81 (-) Transcript_94983:330-572(-)